VTAFVLMIALASSNPQPADVDGGLRTARSRELFLFGAIVASAGAVLVTLVSLKWDYIVLAAKSQATAAGGLTASAGVLVLGLALLYASRARVQA
jgi:hypothetical protein